MSKTVLDERLDAWPFDFADQVRHKVLAQVGRKMALSPNKALIIGDAVRDAVLSSLHDVPKGLDPKQE